MALSLYSVFKNTDFATVLEEGTDLQKLHKAALEAPEGEVVFSDFAPYAAYNGNIASFMGAPVLDKKGEVAGVLVFGVPVSTIAGFIELKKGLGDTGETILVCADNLLRR